MFEPILCSILPYFSQNLWVQVGLSENWWVQMHPLHPLQLSRTTSLPLSFLSSVVIQFGPHRNSNSLSKNTMVGTSHEKMHTDRGTQNF